MWVRTQDKMQLVKINEIHIKVDEDGFVGIWVDGKKESLKYFLGTYKSKERALEVLDEIDSKIMMNKVIEIYSNLGDLTFANRANYTYTPIYQMPEV